VTTSTEMVSHFVDSIVNNVLLQTNSDFTGHFLNLSTFLKVVWLTQCCMRVTDWLFRATDLNLLQFLFILMHISLVLVFPGSAEAHIRCDGN